MAESIVDSGVRANKRSACEERRLFAVVGQRRYATELGGLVTGARWVLEVRAG